METRRPNIASKGFTLLELSIVLVIIGLLVGGVLVGQDLIHAAAIRGSISQIDKYNMAVNTFRNKYGFLPGDIPAGQAAQFGLTMRAGSIGRGDGNSLIEGGQAGCSRQAGEIMMFWNDLSTAGLIDGNYVGMDCAYGGGCVGTSATVPITGLIPGLKLPNNYVTVYGDTGAGSTHTGVNYFQIVGYNGIATQGFWNSGVGPNLTPSEALAIDIKLDDGLPHTGTIIAREYDQVGFDNASAPGAVASWGGDAANCMAWTPPNFTYNTLGTRVNGGPIACTISLRFQ